MPSFPVVIISLARGSPPETIYGPSLVILTLPIHNTDLHCLYVNYNTSSPYPLHDLEAEPGPQPRPGEGGRALLPGHRERREKDAQTIEARHQGLAQARPRDSRQYGHNELL